MFNVSKNTAEDKIYFKICCAILSGLMLGLAFQPSPFYSLAYVAFIPLLYLFVRFDAYSEMLRHSYLFLFVFQLVTLYWTGGFAVGKDIWMMAAGTAVIIVHPFFFIPFILLAFFVKRKLGKLWGLIAFALFWVSFEYLHSLGEYSFPWLTIGNSQAYDLNRIQLVEYVSVYGLSLYLLSFNILSFFVMLNFIDGSWQSNRKSLTISVLAMILAYFGTEIYGRTLIRSESIGKADPVRVGIIQPNVDPWEKWGGNFGDKWPVYVDQYNYLINETKNLSPEKPDIIIWPETAIPFHILLPRYSDYLSKLFLLVDSTKIPVLTGFPAAEYFDSSDAPATSERIGDSRIYVENYNSAVLIKPKYALGPVHKKTILVPFAERIPYAETFRFLIEPLKWNVGISGWGKGNDTVVYSFQLKDSRRTFFSAMICYESAFPNYTREFVDRGAQFLVIITNDSWWGNTSGAYQHAAFASLRAVETRRWVVQCANGGISTIIDPYGRSLISTGLYTRTKFIADIESLSDKTFYVRYGDIVAKFIVVLSVLLLATAFIQRKARKIPVI